METITAQMNGALHVRRLVRALHEQMFFINGMAEVAENNIIRLKYVLDNGDISEVEYSLDEDGYIAAETAAKEYARNWRLQTADLLETIMGDIEFQGFTAMYKDFFLHIKRQDKDYKFPYSVTGYAQCKNVIER